MNKYRLPRKTKKEVGRHLWLYPQDEKGNSLMAQPKRSQEDYNAIKAGIVRNMFDNEDSKARRKEHREKLDKPIMVSDEELKIFVDEIFAERNRNASYRILIEAKNNPKAITAYYNFVNAYNLQKNGDDSFGNICCLEVDLAKKRLPKIKL